MARQRLWRRVRLGGVMALLAIVRPASLPASQAQPPLKQVAVIALPKVSGRIDHLAFDPASSRLFVAALGNDSLEVVDTTKGVLIRSLSGFHEPQGIAVVPDAKGVAIANGGTGTLQLLDLASLQTRWTTAVGGDADNVRYDEAAKRLYVAAEGGLFGVEPSAGRVVQKMPIAGHPESFQLERSGARIVANLPGAGEVVVADRGRSAVDARWPMTACQSNYPMVLDESARRVFVGCRRPAKVAILDAGSGVVTGAAATVGDTDDMFLDSERHRLYVIGGEGFVETFDVAGPTLRGVGRVPTRPGARTGLWVPSQRRLYVAVPARGREPAEVRVFEGTG